MARIMAIDFGTKRMGIAVTDPLKMIATALETVGADEIMGFLAEYHKKEEVECIVIGDPRSAGRGGDLTKMANDFSEQVSKQFPGMRIERVDEFYTSKIAEKVVQQSGIGKMDRRDKSLVDKLSATILLQSYLELKK